MRPGIRLGKPLDFSRYQGMEHDRFVLRAVTDEVMYEIMKLSGQEYVDMYATAAKRQIAEAARKRAEEEKAEQEAGASSLEAGASSSGERRGGREGHRLASAHARLRRYGRKHHERKRERKRVA